MIAEDTSHVRAIERFIGRKITHERIANFEYQYTRLFDTRAESKAVTGKPRGGRRYRGYSFAPGRSR
jgi:hypothetical protein